MGSKASPSIYKGQIPVRTLGQTNCISHHTKILELFCESCNILVCTKCLSTLHKGHDVTELSDTTQSNKTKILNFIDDTEKTKIIELQQMIKTTDEKLKNNFSHFQKLANELQKQGRVLKQEIDVIMTKSLSLYKQLEQENFKLLNTYKTELKEMLNQAETQIHQCKKVLQSGTDIEVFDVKNEIDSQITYPVKPNLGFATFNSSKQYRSHLQEALGTIVLVQPSRDKGQSRAPFGHGWSDVTYGTEAKVERKERSWTPSPLPLKLLPQTKSLSEFESPCNITSIRPTSDGGVVTCHWDRETLTLLDRKGKVRQEIQCSVCIRDISVSPTSNDIWICSSENKSIMKITSLPSKHRFYTEDTPYCLCVAVTNHVIVGMTSKVVRFTPVGEIDLMTKAGRSSRPLVCSPEKIAQCSITSNVAVVDGDCADDDGQDRPHVVVLDNDLREIFNFREPRQAPETSVGSFKPTDVTYDREGNLVVGDRNCFHLVNSSGQYTRMLHNVSEVTVAMCIGRDDTLWGVFNIADRSHIKLLQYTK